MTSNTQSLTAETNTSATPLYQKVLAIAAMMSIMAGTLTGVMTYVNIGFSVDFYMSWLSSFLVAAFVMAPAGMLFMAGLTKAVRGLFPRWSDTVQNVVVGLGMAVIMESLMAFTTTVNNIGFSRTSFFANEWLNSFLVALPVGLGLMVVMSTTVKPRLEQFLKA